MSFSNLVKNLRATLAPCALRFRAWRSCSRPLSRAFPGAPTISMVTTNMWGHDTFPIMLSDWRDFLGVTPMEVIVVDGGSDPDTVNMYRRLFDKGLIDKLYLMQPHHPENHRYLCFIQEYYAGVLASGDYIFSFRQDTLPYRDGYDDWVSDAISLMEGDASIFSVSGSSPGSKPLGQVEPGWWCLEHTSENFALLPRTHHVAAMKFCEDFWSSGWRGVNPFEHISPIAARCMIECAWDKYCRAKGMRVLMRQESSSWSVFHTNERGDILMRLRDLNRKRDQLHPFYNRVGRPFNRFALQS